jgi:hypothetical protein
VCDGVEDVLGSTGPPEEHGRCERAHAGLLVLEHRLVRDCVQAGEHAERGESNRRLRIGQADARCLGGGSRVEALE